MGSGLSPTRSRASARVIHTAGEGENRSQRERRGSGASPDDEDDCFDRLGQSQSYRASMGGPQGSDYVRRQSADSGGSVASHTSTVSVRYLQVMRGKGIRGLTPEAQLAEQKRKALQRQRDLALMASLANAPAAGPLPKTVSTVVEFDSEELGARVITNPQDDPNSPGMEEGSIRPLRVLSAGSGDVHMSCADGGAAIRTMLARGPAHSPHSPASPDVVALRSPPNSGHFHGHHRGRVPLRGNILTSPAASPSASPRPEQILTPPAIASRQKFKAPPAQLAQSDIPQKPSPTQDHTHGSGSASGSSPNGSPRREATTPAPLSPPEQPQNNSSGFGQQGNNSSGFIQPGKALLSPTIETPPDLPHMVPTPIDTLTPNTENACPRSGSGVILQS